MRRARCARSSTLRGHGVLAQLDDFGTGFSALSYLHRFPIECLKIDRSFVAGLTGDSRTESVAVVRAILALAGTLGIDTIAEGIETEAQRERCASSAARTGRGTCSATRQKHRWARTRMGLRWGRCDRTQGLARSHWVADHQQARFGHVLDRPAHALRGPVRTA